MNTPRAAYLTPMIHVTEIERSIRFYEALGMALIDWEGSPIGWARMKGEGGDLMFLRAEESFRVDGVPFLLYLYTPDLPQLREHLQAQGIETPQIARPEHMSSGELRLKDPDGYTVLVGHWGEKEHSEWLARIASRK